MLVFDQCMCVLIKCYLSSLWTSVTAVFYNFSLLRLDLLMTTLKCCNHERSFEALNSLLRNAGSWFTLHQIHAFAQTNTPKPMPGLCAAQASSDVTKYVSVHHIYSATVKGIPT